MAKGGGVSAVIGKIWLVGVAARSGDWVGLANRQHDLTDGMQSRQWENFG